MTFSRSMNSSRRRRPRLERAGAPQGPVAAAADAVGPSPSKANEDEEKRQRQVSELPEGWLSGVQQQGQFRGQTYYYRPGDAEVTFLRPTR